MTKHYHEYCEGITAWQSIIRVVPMDRHATLAMTVYIAVGPINIAGLVLLDYDIRECSGIVFLTVCQFCGGLARD